MSEVESNIVQLFPLEQMINEEYRLAKGCAEDAVKHAIKCGELLIEQKRLVPHGEFHKWIAEHCDFGDRTARSYMTVAHQNGRGRPISVLRDLLSARCAVSQLPPPAPKLAPLPPVAKSRIPRAQRIEQIRVLVAQGYNVMQIADEMGVDKKTVGRLAYAYGIKMHVAKTKDISSHRVVKETVEGIANYVAGLSLLPCHIDIEVTELDEWIKSLGQSSRAIARLRRQLKECKK